MILIDNFIAKSPLMKVELAKAKKFADLKAPLLIEGETGTGKDVLAKACHYSSKRANNTFIAVNCAGLPEESAETEMFGNVETNSKGFFELADKGSVLLDNISEISPSMQAKLLRFLNDGTFRRVGEDREISVDVRVICTSQENLYDWVQKGKFREDLYHRLNILKLTLPSLKERREDIIPLSNYLLDEICENLEHKKVSLTLSAQKLLQNHNWSGNIRSLYNILYRAICLTEETVIDTKHIFLPHNNQIEPNKLNNDFEHIQSLEEAIAEYEEQILRAFFRQYPSSRKLGQRLKISHTAVANKLKMYGISKETI